MALAALPVINAALVNPNNSSEPVQVCSKIGMTQEPADEQRSLIGSNV